MNPATPAHTTPELRPARRALATLLLATLTLAAGCGTHGGGMSLLSITAVLPSMAPATTVTLDAGEVLPIQVAVVNDSTHQGATIVLTGSGTLGAQTVTPLTDSEQITVSYTAPITAPATATVTATANNTPSQTGTVAISVVPALTISPATLPTAIVNTAYTQALTTTGGSGTVKFSLASGTLPVGITLNTTTGALSGTAATAGTYTFAIAAIDSATLPYSIMQSYTLTVNPQPPTVTAKALPNGLVGSPYSQQLAYTGGGTGTATFATISGTLPPGLTLSASGLIAGTPTAAAAGTSSSFTVAVTVGTQTSSAVQFVIVIPALPVIATITLPSGNVGVAYKQQIAFTGGNGATPAFAVTSGTLPAGLTLSPAGLLTGTPTAPGQSTFSVAVTVGPQTSAAQSYTLTINSLIISSSPNAFGEVGLPFSFQLTAVGGTPPYKWALAQGSTALPAGLSLNGATGLISGSPTTATGSTPLSGVTILATDSATPAGSATQAMTFSIAPARSNVNNAQLKGTYAFLLSGFDAAGRPLSTAGNFTADGLGNIVSGTLDINGTGQTTATTAAALAPTTYTIGTDERGQLTLTTLAFGSQTATFTVSLNQIAGGVAQGGYMTEFDTTGQTRTGVLALTTPTAFTTASLTGGYTFGVEGFAANSTQAAPVHRTAIGELQVSGSGTASSAELLLSSGGTGNPLVPTTTTLSVSPSGRGTMAITLPFNGGVLNFAVYVVSPAQYFLISTDPASGTTGTRDLLAGTAYQQTVATGSFNAASLGATSVVRLERLNATTTGTFASDVTVGLLTFSGAGKLTLTADENAGGVSTSNSSSGTYTVAANGRVTATLATASGIGGCTDCASLNTYFYLVGPNRGFVMDFTSAVTTGYFEPQTVTILPIGGAGVNNNSALGTLAPLVPRATLASGLLQLNLTPGTAEQATQLTDQNTAGTLAPDQTAPFTFPFPNTSNGRYLFTGATTPVLYVVSPTKDLELDLSSGTPVVVEITHQ